MSARTIRVATWNVHGLRAGERAVAWVVRKHDPDVLLLQESGPRRRLRELGAMLDREVRTDPRAFPRRRIQNAVLLRSTLANRSRSHLVRFEPSSLVHPRGALIAETDDGWTAASAHLGLHGPERGRHVGNLVATIHGWPAGFVLGADLNALPEDPGPSAVSRLATDCWEAVGEDAGATFPSRAPTARIDYLFAGPAFRPLRAWTAGAASASDHLMVVADLALDV